VIGAYRGHAVVLADGKVRAWNFLRRLLHLRSTREAIIRKMAQCSYTPELADLICTRLSEGESLRSICRDPGMPTEGTVRGWALRNHDSFDARYRQARLLQLDAWADEILDIADQETRDPRDRQVRVDTRKWLMSKIAPKRYGERLLVAGEAENPLQVLHSQVSVDNLTSQQLDMLERFATRLLEAKGATQEPAAG
jgi:hypothetical protein